MIGETLRRGVRIVARVRQEGAAFGSEERRQNRRAAQRIALGAAGHAALAGAVERIPHGAVALLDGLIASAAPEALVPQSDRLRQVVLVHMPLGHRPPGDLTVVPLTDLAPNPVVVAWKDAGPLVRSFAELATAVYQTTGGRRTS